MNNLPSLQGKTILIVEDESELRGFLNNIFFNTGSEIFEAQGGYEALEILKSRSIDIVISDLVMVQGDGLWLFTKIKDELNYVPKIYLCSAYGSRLSDVMKSLGVLSIFQKPYQKHTLLDTIMNSFQTNCIKVKQEVPKPVKHSF